LTLFDIFNAWSKESEKLKKGEITKEEYDVWRYNYPRIESERTKGYFTSRKSRGERIA